MLADVGWLDSGRPLRFDGTTFGASSAMALLLLRGRASVLSRSRSVAGRVVVVIVFVGGDGEPLSPVAAALRTWVLVFARFCPSWLSGFLLCASFCRCSMRLLLDSSSPPGSPAPPLVLAAAGRDLLPSLSLPLPPDPSRLASTASDLRFFFLPAPAFPSAAPAVVAGGML